MKLSDQPKLKYFIESIFYIITHLIKLDYRTHTSMEKQALTKANETIGYLKF